MNLQDPGLLRTSRRSTGGTSERSLAVVTEEARRVITVVAVEDAEALARWIPEWEQLAAASIEPNVFYEPWHLLPAVDAFGQCGLLVHLLVFSSDPASPAVRPQLCGYFPLERVRTFHGMPVPVLTLWKHIHCFLCTPLLRPGYVRQSLAALLEWARTDSRGAAIVQFPQVAGDGPFKKSLMEFRKEQRRPMFVSGTYERALFVPGEDADQYLLASVSAKSRKQLRRLTRRISDTGKVEFAELRPGGDLDAWVSSFLQLEASGWKGVAGSALACHESERRFFTRMTREAFRRNRLMMLAMHLDGRPIAMKCNLLADTGSFAFKIAFDEAFARFSPGVMLEVENIRRLHLYDGIRWMDSCAVSNHSMANRLWIDRRTIQTLVVATGRPLGDLFVRLMPPVRWLAHRVLSREPEESVEAAIGDLS